MSYCGNRKRGLVVSDQLRSEQLAPHSVEAEEAVLGAALINPDALFEVMPFLNAEDFFIVRHAWIWEALIALHERRDPIDYLTVVSELEQVGRLAEIGGAAYVLSLVDKTPSALNAEGYGRIVERMAIRRRGLGAAGQIARVCHSEETDIDEVINQMESAVFEVTERRVARSDRSIKVLVSEHYDHVSYVMRHKDNLLLGPRIPYRDLDDIVGVMQEGDLLIVGARPSMGKSAFVMGIGSEVSRIHPVGIFSLEMSERAIIRRLKSRLGRIDSRQIKRGDLNGEEFDRFLKASEEVSALKLHIDDTPKITPMYIRSKLRRWVLEHGVRLVVVDYLQLMTGGPAYSNSENRVNEIGFISSELKNMAREFRVTIIAAAQLNRAVEGRADKRPLLSDLRDSGTLEQDADIVMFLYRDDYYNENTANPGVAEVRIAKFREGETGMKELAWQPKYTEFADLHKDPLEDVKRAVRGKEK
jgi:replicative DNA helicase